MRPRSRGNRKHAVEFHPTRLRLPLLCAFALLWSIIEPQRQEGTKGIQTLRGNFSTTQLPIFLHCDPADVIPWAETCGEIQCLIEENDGTAGEVHQVRIYNAKWHSHEHIDEFYYVIDGRGTMTLDGTEIELHKAVIVYVPRGTRHKAVGQNNLIELILYMPLGVMHDIQKLEQSQAVVSPICLVGFVGAR